MGAKKTVKKTAKKTTKKEAAKTTKKAVQPLNLAEYLDRVRIRAYEIFQSRGSSHGNDLGDWLEAEREIKKEYGL